MNPGRLFLLALVGVLVAGFLFLEPAYLSGLFSPILLLFVALLGMSPWIARRLIRMHRHRLALRGYDKPARFDRNLIVIGGGAAGLVTAWVAAAAKARVTLVEAERTGGDCLYTGCVPSKTLLRSARLMHEIRQAGDYGVSVGEVRADFPALKRRLADVIRRIEPHDSVERYTELGVDVVKGTARIISPWQVDIDGHRLSTRSIVIATGANPLVPPIPGLADSGFRTSDTLWDMEALPARLTILGGGAIGCELGQAFTRLGSRVTIIEAQPRLVATEDPEVSALLLDQMVREGVDVRLETRAVEVIPGEQPVVHAQSGDDTAEVTGDELLVALGRRANAEDLGLEALGIELNARGEVIVDDCLQTRIPNILACGDVAGPWQFTHAAGHQAWYAAMNALFSPLKRFRVDSSVMPRVTFTDPEIARVGLNESEARAGDIPFEVTRLDLADLDRAIIDGVTNGFVKVLTTPGKDRILGATIVGAHAGELLAEFSLAMRSGAGLGRILATPHPYPTYSEAAKYAAGQWKRRHLPARALALAGRYHRWRCGGLENP